MALCCQDGNADMAGRGCHVALKIHSVACIRPANSLQLENVLEREKGKPRQPSGTLSQALHCSRKEHKVIRPALLSPKALMPKKRRQNDLLFPLACLLRIAHVHSIRRTAGDCSCLCHSQQGQRGGSAPAGESLLLCSLPCPACAEGPISAALSELVTSFTKDGLESFRTISAKCNLHQLITKCTGFLVRQQSGC